MVDELLHLEKEYRDNMLHPREIKQRKMMKLVYVILLNVISTAREHLKTSKSDQFIYWGDWSKLCRCVL